MKRENRTVYGNTNASGASNIGEVNVESRVIYKAKRGLNSSGSGSRSDFGDNSVTTSPLSLIALESVEKKEIDDDDDDYGAISFDVDDIDTYEYATFFKCDSANKSCERCGGRVIWEKNGSVCYECSGAFCEDCCCDEGEYDSDDNFFCGACREDMG